MNSTRLSALAFSCAVASGLGAPALAELTPQMLWENWQAVAEAQGRTLSAEEVTASGNGLALTGLTVVDSNDQRVLTVRLERIQLSEADGGVTVDVATPQTISVDVDAVAEEDATALIALDGSSIEFRAEGEADAPDYVFGAAQFAVSLAELVVEGEVQPAEISLAFTGADGALSGWSAASEERARGALSAETLAFRFDVADPDAGIRIRSSVTQQDLMATLESTPPGADAGVSKLEVVVGSSELNSVQNSPEQSEMASSLGVESGRYALSVADGRAEYDADLSGADLSVSNAQFPSGPVSLSVAEIGAQFSLPMEIAPDPQAMTLALLLKDISFPEALWSALDPALAIPRGPAQFAIDIDADVLVTDTPPAGLEALADGGANYLPLGFRIRGLALEFGGAKVDALGDFSIEAGGANTPIPGALNPVGQLDVDVSGGLGLLQQLVAAGLVQPEQALGAQMMIGMFATQGDGDTLSSTIVSESGGGLVVNGTRLR